MHHSHKRDNDVVQQMASVSVTINNRFDLESNLLMCKLRHVIRRDLGFQKYISDGLEIGTNFLLNIWWLIFVSDLMLIN